MKTKTFFSSINKKLGMISVCLLLVNVLYAQPASLKGTWILDNLEIVEDQVMKPTVLTGEFERFTKLSLSQFTLNTDNTASYVCGANPFSGVPYSVKEDGDGYILTINSEPEVKMYHVTLLPEGKLVLTYSFSGGFIQCPIDIAWKFYYSKKD
jgi:hypothetical protein